MTTRIQRSRLKGSKMAKGAKYVGRPTVFGNPFRVGVKYQNSAWLACMYSYEDFLRLHKTGGITPQTVDECLQLYRLHLDTQIKVWGEPAFVARLKELKGRPLACFCNLSKPCHVDILIEYINKYLPDEGQSAD